MKRSTIAGAVSATVLVLLALAAGYRAFQHVTPSGGLPPAAEDEEEAHGSLLYGRITTLDGATYEGRLRWGGNEEAFWGDYFNGAKKENPWAAQVPPGRLPTERRAIEIFGLEVGGREKPIEVSRLFMARFGDIGRVEASGRDTVRVTLKSGTVIDLDRSAASDFDDDVRVWDGRRGMADLDSLRIRAIDFLPPPHPGAEPGQLHGTVRTRQGNFTGFVQWDRQDCLGRDELDGRSAEGERRLRYDTIRSITRHSRDSSLVRLRDGREIVLSGTRETGAGHRGVYVDDPRYGRVLVSWDAFEGIEFSPGGSGPGYGDFPKGRPLTGTVTTRDGRRLTGRLVYDLDESEVTETLDAPAQGVDYTIPLGLIASITLPDGEERGRARVTLQSGEVLRLECSGDLGKGNAGMLVYAEGGSRPEYVVWSDVERVELDRPTAAYPRTGGR